MKQNFASARGDGNLLQFLPFDSNYSQIQIVYEEIVTGDSVSKVRVDLTRNTVDGYVVVIFSFIC